MRTARPFLPEEMRCTKQKVKHMKNETERKDSDLLTQCQDLATGEAALGNAAGFAQNKAAMILVDIAGLLTQREAVEVGKGTLATYRDVVREVAGTGRMFMGFSRDVFKPRLGGEFSEPWKLVGFEDSLSLPKTPAETQIALKTIQKYLEAHPTYEVAALNITAARAEELFNQLSAARGAVYNQEMVVGTLLEARDAASEKLRRRFRGFVAEATQLLGPLDQRWKAFGLNLPGAQETPEMVEGLQVVLIGATAAAAKWLAPARAEYYRVWIRVLNVDPEYRAVGSPADLDFTIENLPSNAAVDVTLTAVNNGGEGPRSEAVRIVTH
ncbi:MAG: hypothetical protein JWM68_1239 [Verrucomicrobiales bacterium]|nr:hypothetical protein [Verrucomicrobiales bacterium]